MKERLGCILVKGKMVIWWMGSTIKKGVEPNKKKYYK